MDRPFAQDALGRGRLPKLAPDVIHRQRLSKWLGDHADFPLRLLAAPSGSGKTTAMVLYAARPRYPAAYVALEPGAGAEAICAALGAALGLGPKVPAELMDALGALGRCEILIDEADRATSGGREFLRRLVMEAPENVTYVFASRTRDVVDSTRLISVGLAALLNGDRLAFTIDEAAQFVEASSAVRSDDRDVARLVNDTDGWAFALCGTVRDAVSTGRCLEGAVERWQSGSARLIRAFVDDAFAEQDGALVASARRLFDGAATDDVTLDQLEFHGLFVLLTGGVCRPYKVVSRLSRAPLPQANGGLAPFTARLLGAAEVRIDGRRVEWIRRRDGHLFSYVALRPDGRATRKELIAAFWPDADPLLAAQSLRSAFSTMRRALASIVGYGTLGEYVAFGEEIALNLDLFTIDARRALAHVADSDDAAASGDLGAAAEHAAAAVDLARGPFLCGEIHPALASVAAQLETGLARARARCAGSEVRHGSSA